METPIPTKIRFEAAPRAQAQWHGSDMTYLAAKGLIRLCYAVSYII